VVATIKRRGRVRERGCIYQCGSVIRCDVCAGGERRREGCTLSHLGFGERRNACKGMGRKSVGGGCDVGRGRSEPFAEMAYEPCAEGDNDEQ